MDSSKLVLFYEKCRLCLDSPGMSTISTNEDLQQDVFACTGVRVSSGDNLPQKICSQCLEIVANAKVLRQRAIENDAHLRSLFDVDSDEDPRLVIIENSTVSEENSVTINNLEPEIEIRNPRKKIKKVKKRRSVSSVSEDDSKISKLVIKTKEEYMNIRKAVKQEDEADLISYECEICGKTFETWKKLYLHKRGHNKNIMCPLDGCEKKFATKGDLEKHLRTHTGVKPYVCDICDRAFTQQGTLKSHKETVHYCCGGKAEDLPPSLL